MSDEGRTASTKDQVGIHHLIVKAFLRAETRRILNDAAKTEKIWILIGRRCPSDRVPTYDGQPGIV